MEIYHHIESIPHRALVLTIGTFDGVHTAHRSIIDQLVKTAAHKKNPSMLLTFSPHPRSFVGDADQPPIQLLTSDRQKIKALSPLGLDVLLIQKFDRDFSELSAKQYLEDYLLPHLQPSHIIIGYDHKFGRDRSGDIELLRQYADEYNFEVEEIPQIELDHVAISSSQIRRDLSAGQIREASVLLGRPYSLRGTVIKGLQNGRKLGYPTANIKPDNPDVLIPRDGVYDVDVVLDDRRYKGALNIGYRPSVDAGLQHTIEVYILDFDEDIYGREIEIEFLDFLRPELKFDTLEELKKQISKDVQRVGLRVS